MREDSIVDVGKGKKRVSASFDGGDREIVMTDVIINLS